MFAYHLAIKDFADSDLSYMHNRVDVESEKVRFSNYPRSEQGYWVHYAPSDSRIDPFFDDDSPFLLEAIELDVTVQGASVRARTPGVPVSGVNVSGSVNAKMNYFQMGSIDYLLRLLDYIDDLVQSFGGIFYDRENNAFQTWMNITVKPALTWKGREATWEDLL